MGLFDHEDTERGCRTIEAVLAYIHRVHGITERRMIDAAKIKEGK